VAINCPAGGPPAKLCHPPTRAAGFPASGLHTLLHSPPRAAWRPAGQRQGQPTACVPARAGPVPLSGSHGEASRHPVPSRHPLMGLPGPRGQRSCGLGGSYDQGWHLWGALLAFPAGSQCQGRAWGQGRWGLRGTQALVQAPSFFFQSGAARASGDGWGARSSAILSSEGGPAVLQEQVQTTVPGPHYPALCSRTGPGRAAGGQAVKGKWGWGQGPACPLSRQEGGTCPGSPAGLWPLSHLLCPGSSACDLPQTRPGPGAPLSGPRVAASSSPHPATGPPPAPSLGSRLSISIRDPAVWPGEPPTTPLRWRPPNMGGSC